MQATENYTNNIVERLSTPDEEVPVREGVTCSLPKAQQLQSTSQTAPSTRGNLHDVRDKTRSSMVASREWRRLSFSTPNSKKST